MIEGMVINLNKMVAWILQVVTAGATSNCARCISSAPHRQPKASDSQQADLGFFRLLHFASRIRLLSRVEISIRRNYVIA